MVREGRKEKKKKNLKLSPYLTPCIAFLVKDAASDRMRPVQSSRPVSCLISVIEALGGKAGSSRGSEPDQHQDLRDTLNGFGVAFQDSATLFLSAVLSSRR